ncbi:hypothetical protein ARMGADRAFT_1039836 [Armillaria gallica]|uniref:Uncharacterized protein n=1 Tax=Armillaria gallica TaxID=47427 RepID=A0A2H3CC69_ARMGA|nr:hypothetical protein ARMGADRAFT_1040852 [Armillaria gallica]PBK80675.1 hypothetical protein ARMGADRAFT_1039836 [Armillaria gallica]
MTLQHDQYVLHVPNPDSRELEVFLVASGSAHHSPSPAHTLANGTKAPIPDHALHKYLLDHPEIKLYCFCTVADARSMPLSMKYMQFKNHTNVNIGQWAFACALSHSGCGYWAKEPFFDDFSDFLLFETLFWNYCNDAEQLSKEGEMVNLLESSKVLGFMPVSSPAKGIVTCTLPWPHSPPSRNFSMAKAIQAVKDGLPDDIINISLDLGEDGDNVVKEEHQEKILTGTKKQSYSISSIIEISDDESIKKKTKTVLFQEGSSCTSTKSAKGKEKQNMHGPQTSPHAGPAMLPGKQGHQEESPQTLLKHLNAHDMEAFHHLVTSYRAHSDNFHKLWDVCNKCSHYFPKVYAQYHCEGGACPLAGWR